MARNTTPKATGVASPKSWALLDRAGVSNGNTPIRYCIRNEFSQYLETYTIRNPEAATDRVVQSCRWSDHASHAMLFVLASEAQEYLDYHKRTRFGFHCAVVVQAGTEYEPLTTRLALNLSRFLDVIGVTR